VEVRVGAVAVVAYVEVNDPESILIVRVASVTVKLMLAEVAES
jgi:hypothetical protein